MEIIKTATGFAIRFPFPLKDAFRAAFPAAKWNADEKRWEVGPRSGKRLEQWAAEAQEATADILAREEVEMNAVELAQVRAAIAQARRGAKSAEASAIKLAEIRAQLIEVNAELAAAQGELAAAKSKADVESAKVEQEKAAILGRLGATINMTAVKDAERIMAMNMNSADRRKKDIFETARATVKAERNKLRDAGFECVALEILATANVNRPDRDHPKFIKESDWYAVRPYNADEV